MTFKPDFRIETSRKGTISSIALAGELDGDAAKSLSEAVADAIDAHDEGELILDMEKISFIDSAGMRAIIHLERAARGRRVPLVVLPPPVAVTELLHTAGLARRLTLSDQSDMSGENFVERVELNLPLDPTAPGRARQEVRELMRDLGDDVLAVATLLTSELVTNAVIHPSQASGAEVRLVITFSEERVRVEVSDRGPGFDPHQPREASDQGGRGLLLVDQLASRWGTSGQDGAATKANEPPASFSVWFELDRVQAADSAASAA